MLRGGVIILVLWGTYNTLALGKYSMENWITLVIAGLAQGSIYSLLALGYSLVYGILKMINFAHGEVFMAGAYTAFFVARATASNGFLDQNPFLAIIGWMVVAVVVSTIVALLLD